MNKKRCRGVWLWVLSAKNDILKIAGFLQECYRGNAIYYHLSILKAAMKNDKKQHTYITEKV